MLVSMKKITSRAYRNLYIVLAFIPLLFLLALLISTKFASRDADGMYLVSKMHGKEMPFKVRLSDLGGQSPLLIPSPANDRMLVVLWEDAGHTFYLTDREGSFMKRLSRQSVAEGSGQILRETISWSEAGDAVTYVQSGVACEDTCETPDDFRQVYYLHSVDIETLEETRAEIREEELF